MLLHDLQKNRSFHSPFIGKDFNLFYIFLDFFPRITTNTLTLTIPTIETGTNQPYCEFKSFVRFSYV